MLLQLVLLTVVQDKYAHFTLRELTPAARVFFNDREYTAKYQRQIKDGTLRANFGPLASGEYQVVVRVELPAENGQYTAWISTNKYRAGDNIDLYPYTKKPEGDQVGRLRVIVTLDALVFINNKLTLQEGEVRDFHTNIITQPEKVLVKFDFRNGAGRRIIRTTTVTLHAGETVTIFDPEKVLE